MEVILPLLVFFVGLGFLGSSAPTPEHESELDNETKYFKNPWLKELQRSTTQTQNFTRQLRVSAEALRKKREKLAVRRELLDLRREELYRRLELAEAQIKKESSDPPSAPEPTSEEP